jgi:hypothetical protein
MSQFVHLCRASLESFKVAWRASKTFRFCFLAAFFLWFLFTALLFFRLMPGEATGKFIPLHYNIYFGVDKFGPWYSVFELSLFGLLVLILNTWLAARYFERESALAAFLNVVNPIVQFLLLAATYFIILLNL